MGFQHSVFVLMFKITWKILTHCYLVAGNKILAIFQSFLYYSDKQALSRYRIMVEQ